MLLTILLPNLGMGAGVPTGDAVTVLKFNTSASPRVPVSTDGGQRVDFVFDGGQRIQFDVDASPAND